MMLRPWEVNEDVGKARLGVALAAKSLGLEFDCKLSTMWRITVDGTDKKAFLELAKEASENTQVVP